MPKLSIYVKDDAQATLEKAKKISGLNVSALVEKLVTDYVDSFITVEIAEDDDQPPVKKRFRGKWLVKDFISDDEKVHAGTSYDAALTAKGRIVVLYHYRYDDVYDGMSVYNAFEHLDPNDGWPEDLISAIGSALGEDYVIDLDI